MDLQKNSLEYAHIIFSAAPPAGAVVQASVDLVTWVPLVFDDATHAKVLLRGPSSSATTGLLVSGSEQLWIQVANSPEIAIRSAGIVSVY